MGSGEARVEQGGKLAPCQSHCSAPCKSQIRQGQAAREEGEEKLPDRRTEQANRLRRTHHKDQNVNPVTPLKQSIFLHLDMTPLHCTVALFSF